MPTSNKPWTGKEWVEKVAEELHVKSKYQVVPKFLVRLLGVFMPIMRESVEMQYQYDRDYVFDSSKFQKAFDFKPTSYEEGVKAIVATDYYKNLNLKFTPSQTPTP